MYVSSCPYWIHKIWPGSAAQTTGKFLLQHSNISTCCLIICAFLKSVAPTQLHCLPHTPQGLCMSHTQAALFWRCLGSQSRKTVKKQDSRETVKTGEASEGTSGRATELSLAPSTQQQLQHEHNQFLCKCWDMEHIPNKYSLRGRKKKKHASSKTFGTTTFAPGFISFSLFLVSCLCRCQNNISPPLYIHSWTWIFTAWQAASASSICIQLHRCELQ